MVGLGYVGIPLAVLATTAGHEVTGIDINPDRVRERVAEIGLNLSAKPTKDAFVQGPKELWLFNFSKITSGPTDVFVITVDTPAEAGRPDIQNLLEASSWVGQHVRKGSLVIVESTVAPGTTRQDVLPILEQRAGLTAGKEFFLAFSPERIDPGNSAYGLSSTPKLVAGLNDRSLILASEFYRSLGIATIGVSGLEEAEMAKLVENSFRAVNLAFANEVHRASTHLGLSWEEVLTAAGTKPFGFMRFNPGTGVGGHCIPVDPYYLLNSVSDEQGFCAMPLLSHAMSAIEARPLEMAKKVLDYLEFSGKNPSEARVLLVGISYKPGVRDTRNSPAIALGADLIRSGVKVLGFDSKLQKEDWMGLPFQKYDDSQEWPTLAVILSSAEKNDLEFLRHQGLDLFDPMHLNLDARVNGAVLQAKKSPSRRGSPNEV